MSVRKSFPNFLTSINLLFGCIAVTFIIHGDIQTACIFVLFAALMDYLDGFFAKKLNAGSNLGRELDSLADMVTFGVVPGFVFYYLLDQSSYFSLYPAIHPIIYLSPAFLITIFSALRLAKYNISDDQKEHFLGLPTPACTLLVISFPLLMNRYEGSFFSEMIGNPIIIYGLIIVLSYLLISNIRMFSLRFTHFRFKENEIRYIFIFFTIILIAIFKLISIGWIILLYIIISLISNVRKHEIPSAN